MILIDLLGHLINLRLLSQIVHSSFGTLSLEYIFVILGVNVSYWLVIQHLLHNIYFTHIQIPRLGLVVVVLNILHGNC